MSLVLILNTLEYRIYQDKYVNMLTYINMLASNILTY